MVETTAVQRSELDARRQALRARTARFRRQVAADADRLRDDAKHLIGSESPMSDHPKTTVGLGAATGFVVARASVPRPDLGTPTAPVAKLAKRGLDAGGGLLRVEAGMVIKDFIDGLFTDRPDASSIQRND